MATEKQPNPITEKNVAAIGLLEKQAMQRRTASEYFAELITRYAGGMAFILLHIIWFTGWILFNLGMVSGITPWDPFPFGFLTLVVSLEAIFLSLLVLMTQNRLTQDADKRVKLDLQINMLAEQESTATLQMLEKICKHLGVDYEAEEEKQLAKQTDVNLLAKTVDEKLTS